MWVTFLRRWTRDCGSCQFYDLKVAERTVVDGEAYEGAYFVESVDACSTGVDVQGVDGSVVHHLEDV